jgi:hypothetical protein
MPKLESDIFPTKIDPVRWFQPNGREANICCFENKEMEENPVTGFDPQIDVLAFNCRS